MRGAEHGHALGIRPSLNLATLKDLVATSIQVADACVRAFALLFTASLKNRRIFHKAHKALSNEIHALTG